MNDNLSLLIEQLGDVHLNTEDLARKAYFELQMKAILREIAARLDRQDAMITERNNCKYSDPMDV